MPMQIGSLFQTNHENIMNLELDTFDNKKPLSIRIVSLKDVNQWSTTDYAKALKLVVTQCLLWPKGIFESSTQKSKALNHTRMNEQNQLIGKKDRET